ncbi:MAG: hypothetical protein CM1200mP16_12210 [Nitrospina sp.]|nr:MAG: hypothetical protein CM1200mP16_12210 [Nitrospina sp.]
MNPLINSRNNQAFHVCISIEGVKKKSPMKPGIISVILVKGPEKNSGEIYGFVVIISALP